MSLIAWFTTGWYCWRMRGTHPHWFFSAPVIFVIPCVLMIGSVIMLSASISAFGIPSSLKTLPAIFCFTSVSSDRLIILAPYFLAILS